VNPTLAHLRNQASIYFASKAAVALGSEPRASAAFPVHLIGADADVARHHYWRFIQGCTDDHALAGWRFVMDGRAKAARAAGRFAMEQKANERKAS
jgi:hypothetical protein